MERDFEREFKELKLSEVPDLWSRIEASLPEKNSAAAVVRNAVLYTDKYKSAKKIAWRRWGTLAAACLCVAVILPALSFVIGNMGGRKNSYSGSPAANADTAADGSAGNMSYAPDMTNASEMMTEAAAAEEDIDMTSASDNGMSTEQSAGAEMADSDESLGASMEESKQMSSMLQENEGAASKTDPKEAELLNGAQDRVSADDAVDTALEDGQGLDGVVISIEEAYTSGNEVIYRAVVEQPDADGLLNTGAWIDVVCNSDTEYGFSGENKRNQGLKTGESYEVSLRYEMSASGNGRFVVIVAD